MKKIVLIMLLFFGFMSYGSAYFENKYYCDVSSSKISIVLKQKDGYKKCMEVIQDINKKLSSIDINLQNAQKNIDRDEDTQYWKTLSKSLERQKELILDSKTHLIDLMSKFEDDLFKKLYQLLSYYLIKEKDKIQTEYNKMDDNLRNAVNIGMSEDFKFYQDRRDAIMVKLKLIYTIINAKSMDELMPNLKIYMNYFQ